MAEKLIANLKTNRGNMKVQLFPDHAPKTVRNFVELAEGTREWTHPETGEKTTDKLYDGTVFHRVINGFMIQGGDPLGKGIGGPGYEFDDEIHPDLYFNRPYLLAMANAGILRPRHQRLAVLRHRRARRRTSTASTPSSVRSRSRASDVVDAIAKTARPTPGTVRSSDVVLESVTIERVQS